MKSLKTMHGLARAMAIAKGPRIWSRTRCGYYLTIGELHQLYNDEGFNHRGTCMRRHIGQWMCADMAILEGSEYNTNSAVWFECPAGSETMVKVFSECCGGRYVTKIDRNQWPSLRRMHGIQEQEVLA